ncbi:ankyrin repeat domain-containing protein [Bremerella sp. T1]|uniref:ankyrin repeat domain-containing protein n=1 Tax=Bremerella sp. TYQ1 TaxID=3119568 RepID=UPI001CCA1F33|nr:ankyrin repeat domain-containing protein [Bremerella volcania]UBM37679.1 ankyrin repeat domain-containing protein [Bremerella volcania]
MFEEETELYRAVINRDIDEVRTILERDTSQLDVGDEDRHSTPLHIASFDGQAHICKLLLMHGANVDARDINGCTPLHEAEQQGYEEVVKVLLAHGASVEIPDHTGWTPIYASTAGNSMGTNIWKVLLDHGARLDLNSALRLDKFEYVRETLERGGTFTSNSLFPEELLVDLVEWTSRYDEVVSMAALLLQHGVNVNGMGHMKQNALMIACSNPYSPGDLIRMLLEHGADPTMRRTVAPATAYQMAQSAENQKAIEILESFGISE